MSLHFGLQNASKTHIDPDCLAPWKSVKSSTNQCMVFRVHGIVFQGVNSRQEFLGGGVLRSFLGERH